MRKLEIVLDLVLGCLAVVGMLAGMFLALLFLSEALLKLFELTGATRIPEVGRIFADLFYFWVIFATILFLGFAMAHRFGPTIEAYGDMFEFYFAIFILLLFSSWFVAFFEAVEVINLQNLINSFIKNLPPPHPVELSKYYGGMFRSWPLWTGVGLLFLLLLWSYVLPTSFASFLGAEKLRKGES